MPVDFLEALMKQEKSCGALVFRKIFDVTQILLIKNRKGSHWSFPKGHVEEGETEQETALREVKEETGINIEIIDGFRETVHYKPSRNIEKDVVYFVAYSDPKQVIVRQKEEVSQCGWFFLTGIENKLTFKNDKVLIRLAIEKLNLEVK